jgi:hypothetical protein
MTRWIRGHTARSATIIAPPWEGAFWLEAERAEVANFKRAPHSARILEWYRRMTALNGGRPFHSVGYASQDELRKNYPTLDRVQIEAIREAYGGDYYLTTRRREDLIENLVHQNGAYYLYDIQTIR